MVCRQVIDWSATAAWVQALGSLGAVWTAVFIARGQAAREKKRIADAVEEARCRRITLAESVARLVTTRLALAESQLQSTTPAAARVAAEGMRSDLGMIDRFPIWELESVPAVHRQLGLDPPYSRARRRDPHRADAVGARDLPRERDDAYPPWSRRCRPSQAAAPCIGATHSKNRRPVG